MTTIYVPDKVMRYDSLSLGFPHTIRKMSQNLGPETRKHT